MNVAELVARLVEAGATPEVIKIAVEGFDSQRAAYEALRVQREEDERVRKQSQRERTAKSRRRKRGGSNGNDNDTTPPSGNGNAPVTLPSRDTPSPSPQENNSTPLTPTPSPSANAPGEAAPDGALPPTEAGSNDGSTKRKPRKPETLIDPNRTPDDADRAFVAERGMPPTVARNEWVKFVSHHVAKGSLMRDWNAAWRTWVMRWQESQPPPGQLTPKRSVQTAARDLLAQFRQGAPDEPFLALPSRNRA